MIVDVVFVNKTLKDYDNEGIKKLSKDFRSKNIKVFYQHKGVLHLLPYNASKGPIPILE